VCLTNRELQSSYFLVLFFIFISYCWSILCCWQMHVTVCKENKYNYFRIDFHICIYIAECWDMTIGEILITSFNLSNNYQTFNVFLTNVNVHSNVWYLNVHSNAINTYSVHLNENHIDIRIRMPNKCISNAGTFANNCYHSCHCQWFSEPITS